MMSKIKYTKRLIHREATISFALGVLNEIAPEPIAFVINDKQRLLGSLTDGDIRRGLLKGYALNDAVENIIQKNPVYLRNDNYSIDDIIDYRKRNIMILPIVDEDKSIINVISLRHLKSFLPVDVVMMAGGRGERLRPLTDEVPKPMLKIGDMPIIEHNISRLSRFGINNFWISINYKGDIVKSYFDNHVNLDINIEYIEEDKPMGTIGSVSKISNFRHDHVLIVNSDILTNVDFEDFFLDYIHEKADLSVLSIPYKVSVPYAVLENNERTITGFSEKPTYTYYSSGGIYLVKKDLLINNIPGDSFFNATDLIEKFVRKEYKVISYHLNGYWLDIGKHEDYTKAQEDIKTIKFY